MHYQPKQDLLEQRIILVTGAGDGIGHEAALNHARWCPAGAAGAPSKLLALQQIPLAQGGAPALIGDAGRLLTP